MELNYHRGVIDALNEMIASCEKPLAMSHPLTESQAQSLLAFCKEITKQYGTAYYLEKQFLVSDLFEASITQGKCIFLFYRENQDLKQYQQLKEERAQALKKGCYTTEKRFDIAYQFGVLLGYRPKIITQKIQGNLSQKEAQ